ncbi:hypothetical protein [Catellatospora sp. NPDC049609]|uniref:hypothetical protein n=1 Tax=Catellatospora sp. NPDC049609 TaxID=3155505 RepID=UPI003416E2E8
MTTVDLDLLADYVGGALEGTPDEARVARLIAEDPAWHTAADELRAALSLVSADLTAFAGTPEPMPADVAARFDALLASPEFAPVPAAAPRSGTGERTLARTEPSGRPARRRRRWAMPVAVAAGVLVVAGVALPLGPLGMTAQDEAAAPAAADAPSAEVWSAAGSIPAVASGTDYRREDLRDAVRTQAQASEPATAKSTEVAPLSTSSRATDSGALRAPSGLERLAGSSEALSRCLAAVQSTVPGTVTSVDFARFEGRPAVVLRLDTGQGGWWFVAGARCGENGPDELFRAPLS